MSDERGHAFTFAAARAAGMSTGRLRHTRFARPFHGVRVDGRFDGTDIEARARALRPRMAAGQFFAHATAAALLGIPLPRRLADPGSDLELGVFAPDRAPQLRGVRSHEITWTGQQLVNLRGLPVLGPADTWAQLSTALSIEELVIAADWLITGDEPYSGAAPPSSLVELDQAIARRGRMRGVRSLRAAKERTRYGSLSPQETRLRLLLADAHLPEPALNHRIVDDHGALVAMVDFAYPDRSVALEYLGDHHRTERSVYRDDILRRERLTARGWSVIYTTAADLVSPAFLLIRLRRLLASTGKTS
ncbi:hypothetical protein [Leifsonia sp. NPDC080035]|uniref:DUF559 domain-containing protein n=1 Tax=Leifsonia sp. NPDC080035 TaxID=3143936 RepID=A0AAU7GH33_9MICO